MSSKKDNLKNLDKYFMSIAMNLANERIGLTGLNPSVGCVIVKNNKILSFGQTGFKGRPHAETVAINKCKKNELKGSSIYITMEPCTHYGKTPPCTNQIIKKIADNYKPAANLRDINIKLNLLTDYNIEILLDRILLEVTLRNLIDNAIKYSPIEENIIIKSIINNNKYIILIENISLNMDKINKNQLVKRFSRGKNHKNIIGTGLGLAIVTEAVQALKGKFNIKIENKKKLITSILLPLK